MNRHRVLSRWILWLGCSSVLVCLAAEVQARPRFRPIRIKDADTLFTNAVTGLGSFPRLNNRNQIAFTTFENGKFTAKLWDDGNLYTTGDQTGYSRVLARGLNDSGQVVGEAQFHSSGVHVHGFVATLQSFSVLPITAQAHIDTFCTGATVYGINESGVASGWSSYALSPGFAFYRPVVWQGGSLVESGTIPAHPADSQDFHWPVVINNSGTIAGTVHLFYSAYWQQYHGYYGPPGSVTEVEPYPGGTSVYLYDINDQGVLAGQSEGSWGSSHAILVEGGSKKDIHGTVFAQNTHSAAYAVNDSGVAVGWWLGGRGLYYDNDTTWLIDSLLATRFFPDGGQARLFEAIDINNQGVVLALYEGPGGFSYPCLLVPVDSGTIVNTDNDLPDLNPNDGRCYTGNVTALGEDECSLRAALQHSNGHAGADTVRFKIPVPGVPLIAVGSPLPTVTDEVYIDAATQPGANQVEVVPADSLVGGDGLVITTDDCTVRGLLINGFAGSGLVLDSADFCHIELCHFGARSDTSAAGNGTFGVFIQDANGNHLGDTFDDEPNVIAYNGSAGILIASGYDNDVAFNHIFDNGGLGIDLAPLGVTVNDPLDADLGANDLVNYPYFDSVVTSSSLTRVYGTIPAGNTSGYDIEVYRSDTCDASGYGEGRRPVGGTFVSTPAFEEKAFQTSFADSLLPGEFLTMTATPTSGGTSEFSPCWPSNKWVRLLDGQGAAITNRLFELSRIANDPPVFTESFLDTVTTDSAGRVDLKPYYDADALKAEDSVKLSKVLDFTPRFKAGPPITGRCMTLYLDNGKFDSTDYHYYFDELDREPHQDVSMNHTTVGLNLVVSVEWEADAQYFSTMQTGLRGLSDYLYDVFDGQVRLDTVFLYNNAELWAHADVRVKASNTLRPHAAWRGVYEMGTFVNFCRRWHNAPPEVAVERSLTEWPMQPDDIDHYRTVGHELGHYLFGFRDEYFEDRSRRCDPFHFYGFMDTQYPTHEPSASELSWAEQYTNAACRNNAQYGWNGTSCWDQWEQEYQIPYNGVHAEILKPSERLVPGLQDHFFGPNDWNTPVQYDVGSLVQFQTNVSGRTSVDKRMYFRGPGGPLAGMDVSLLKSSSGRIIEQGHTAANGGIWVLGGTGGDSIIAALGRLRRPFLRAAAAADSDHVWHSVVQEFVPGGGDSAEVAATEVAGYLPALCELVLSAGDPTLVLYYQNPFDLPPAIQFWDNPDSGQSALLVANSAVGAYSLLLPIGTDYSGTSLVRALDTAGAPFVFDIGLSVAEIASAVPVRVNSVDGSSYLDIDDVAQSGRASLVTSAYLALRSGLDPRACQLGTTASVSCYPAAAFDSAYLVITYGEFDLAAAEPPFDQEVTVRVFAWDATGGQWNLLGGAVDTQLNFVSAVVPGPGLYAAFTTGQVSGIGDEHQGAITPETYELAQNHPNPFNPTTSISYTLPQPGRVTLHIHNILGQTVRTLVNEIRAAGRHEVLWDGRTASGAEAGSGVYFYSLRAGDVVLTRKMVLMK